MELTVDERIYHDLRVEALERLNTWAEDTIMRLEVAGAPMHVQVSSTTFPLLEMFAYLTSVGLTKSPEEIGDKAREIITELVTRYRKEQPLDVDQTNIG